MVSPLVELSLGINTAATLTMDKNNTKKAKKFGRSDAQNLITAYHEAGHAVANLLLELKIKRLTIIPSGDYAGCCDGFRPRDICESLPRLQKEIKILLAGKIAQIKFKPGSWRLRQTQALVVGKFGVAGDDHEVNLLIDSLAEKDYEEARLWRRLLTHQTKKLLDRNWAFVKRLAAELLEKGELTDAEVKDIYRRTLNLQHIELSK
jgi:ATP-dependent Zn protease